MSPRSRQRSRRRSRPGAKHEDGSIGTPLGRAVATRVLAFSATDLVGLTDPGKPPTTPGHWLRTGGPITRDNLGARPFFLATRDEFRLPPPPAFGSPEYLAALAEVRQISDTRTPQQLAIAQTWNVGQSPNSNSKVENLAVELIRAHRRSEIESARILFRMNAAIFDALIGCFDAKYTYWFIRPSQADPLNHPTNRPAAASVVCVRPLLRVECRQRCDDRRVPRGS